MFRRNPTRIELKLDDLQEYENLKKEIEEKKSSNLSMDMEASDSKYSLQDHGNSARNKLIHERIGYSPQPKMAL